jgi:outer membrane immunogenic protein
MKKVALFLAALVALPFTPALAADMPLKAPPMAPAAAWTGCYIGVEGGGSWDRSYSVAAAGDHVGAYHQPALDLNGGLVGGTIGCNYQTGNWVFGAEGDFSWTNSRGSSITPPPFNTAVTITDTEQWLGTARGRLGYAWNNWLVYATGGAAWAQLNLVETDGVTFFESENRVLVGGTGGGGVEWMFAPQWSAKAEYLWVGFQSTQYFGVACCTLENRHLSDNIFRVGVNYHFWTGR